MFSKIVGVANGVSYKIAKYQLEMVCILSYTKIIKSNKFGDLKICILRSTLFTFLCNSEYKIFETDFLHVCNIHY